MGWNLLKLEPVEAFDWLRPWRYLWRLPLLVLHLGLGLPVVVLTMVVVGDRMQIGNEALHRTTLRYWAGLFCRLFGVRIQSSGKPCPGPVLLVANHVSWLDILVTQAQCAASFVGKAEIRRWPLIGWMAVLSGTVFHQRGCGASSGNVTEAMTAALLAGRTMAIFPEGRTGPGDRVLPFHGRLLQAAVGADCPVQPVALRFARNRKNTMCVAFAPNESFVANFWRLLGQPPSVVEVSFLNPIMVQGQGRREIINQARDAIVRLVDDHND